ncbi:MAG: hypothetical protein DI636_04680 [Pelagerythrobacter marensis]|nr:MAG: hypothetical protein DI636_04680 [Pelagerythrobacter marensis]PZU14325.1 MAG: hypothetical protein DI591_12260 [Citromicrobium sp.]
MACPQVITGDAFLTRVITHIDCQAQLLGSFGFQALGQPGSPVSLAMSALLTLFVAIYGIRLIVGVAPGARDALFDVLRIGIVLTLAFSWPAFRTLVYDITFHAPAELAGAMLPASLSPPATGLIERLQGADDAMTRLGEMGTGRVTGAYIDPAAPGGTFRASMLDDETGFGWARLIWLAAIMGSVVLLRIAGAVLLALAPIAAAMLLFEPTRGLFAGWLRGMVFVMLASLGLTVMLTAQMALMEPWLADALKVRSLGYAIPSAPVELLALALAFAIALPATLAVFARVAFSRSASAGHPHAGVGHDRAHAHEGVRFESRSISASDAPASRAQRLSDSVEATVRRERVGNGAPGTVSVITRNQRDSSPTQASPVAPVSAGQSLRLGDSYRRSGRTTLAARRRDGHQ